MQWMCVILSSCSEAQYEMFNDVSERDFCEVGVGPPMGSEAETSGVTPV